MAWKPHADGTVVVVDEVELKVTVQEGAVADAEREMGLDPGGAQERWIWFYEIPTGGTGRTPLLSRGLMLRLRAGRKRTTATLKLRGPEGCLDLAAWRGLVGGREDAKVEGDWSGQRRLVSASVDADTDTGDHARQAADTGVGDRLSWLQRKLIGDWFVPVDGLRPLGPVAVSKWDGLDLPGRGEELVAERWVVDGLRFLEFSVRVPAADADNVQELLRAHLASRGVHEDPDAPTKTETVVSHLAGRET